MMFNDLSEPMQFPGATKSVLLCDAPFLEGLESGYSDRSHNADVPDDLLACTPLDDSIHGWDSPPDSPAQVSIETLEGYDPLMMHDKLNSIFDNPGPSMLYDWSPPESSCGDGSESESDVLADFPDLAAFDSDSESGSETESTTLKPLPFTLKLDGVKLSNKRKASASGDERERKRARDKQDAARLAHTEACELAVKALAHTKNDEDPESKRHTHNVLERKRRNDLKNSYQLLRERVPSLEDDDRAPTGKILLHAVEFIAHLKKTESLLTVEMQRTTAENERLRRLAGLL